MTIKLLFSISCKWLDEEYQTTILKSKVYVASLCCCSLAIPCFIVS